LFSSGSCRGPSATSCGPGDGAGGVAAAGGVCGGGRRDGAGFNVVVEALDYVAGGGGFFEVEGFVAVDGFF